MDLPSDSDLRAALTVTEPVTLRMPFDFRAVVTEIAAAHGLSFDELMRRTRVLRIAEVRWRVFALLHGRQRSLPEIARHWGMDHTTVLHGLRQLKAHAPEVFAHYVALGAESIAQQRDAALRARYP